MILADLSGPLPWIALAAAAAVFLLVDFKFFPEEIEPSSRKAVRWTIGWTAVSLAAALPLWATTSGHAAFAYLAVYLVTRALSFDNLLVFILLFAYFQIPVSARAKLLAWGIVGMLTLRGAAILGGLALIHRLHFIVYLLGALLIFLAWRVRQGVEDVHPERSLVIRFASRLGATPLLLCVVAVITADIAFAIDSIPAGFAITGNSFLIWMGNVFSLLGLPALFVLVRDLVARFRYLNEAVALLLALVGLKLIIERWIGIGTGVTLGVVAGVFAVGIVASVLAGDRFKRDGPGASGRAGHPPRHR